MKRIAAPFGDPGGDLSNIEADRKSVAGKIFKDIDVLLLPTTATSVPAVKDVGVNNLALSPENTVFANYYGLPAISVPCGFDRNGLPLGLQIVGKPWDEATVLSAGHRYETATLWGTKQSKYLELCWERRSGSNRLRLRLLIASAIVLQITSDLPTTRPMTSAMQAPKDAVNAFLGKTVLDTELTEMMIQMFVH